LSIYDFEGESTSYSVIFGFGGELIYALKYHAVLLDVPELAGSVGAHRLRKTSEIIASSKLKKT